MLDWQPIETFPLSDNGKTKLLFFPYSRTVETGYRANLSLNEEGEKVVCYWQDPNSLNGLAPATDATHWCEINLPD